MNTQVIGGLGYGILSMFFFGLYGIPRKYTKSTQMAFLLTMCITAAFLNTIIGFLFHPSFSISFQDVVLSYVSGILWCFGTLSFIFSIDYIGVGKATPIKNCSVVLGVFFGLIVFREYSPIKILPLALLVVGSSLVIASGVVLSRLSLISGLASGIYPVNFAKIGKKLNRGKDPYPVRGFCFAVMAALFHGSFVILGKVVIERVDSIWQYFMFVGQGALLGHFVGYTFLHGKSRVRKKVPIKDHWWAALSGLLWVFAFASMIKSIQLIGLATGWPLANLNTVVTVIYSALILREVSFPAQKSRILRGLGVGCAGILALALARFLR